MIVLDTHVLIWWVNGDKQLSKVALSAIEKAAKEGQILVSSISIWEIYLLIKKGRLKLTIHPDVWVQKIENLDSLQFIPIDNQIAAQSVLLPGDLHDDPADRIIVATALNLGADLVTSDSRILNYPHLRSVW